MNMIVFSQSRFLDEYRALRAKAQGPVVFSTLPFGTVSDRNGVQILISPRSIDAHTAPLRTLRFSLSSTLANESPERLLASQFGAALVLGHARDLGRARGFIRTASGAIEPVSELVFPDPGLLRISLVSTSRSEARGIPDTFSRVAGALTEPVFHLLRETRFAFVGAGRLGGCLSSILARDGAARFTLIDPDRYELHNGAGGIYGTPSDVGQSKVKVLGRTLRQFHSDIEVEEITHSITHLAVLPAMTRSDIIVSTVDHDAARLAAAWLAALYLKPLLDVGSGVYQEHGQRNVGADIRLVSPGEGCLLCRGGLRAPIDARRVLASAEAERLLRTANRDFRRERAGSLCSLNTAAAGVAARLIEDFIAGTSAAATAWVRLEFSEDGRLRVWYPEPASADQRDCCCWFAGFGDDGLPDVVKELAAAATVNRGVTS